MISTITYISVESGSKPHTTQYGSTVIFLTKDGQRLYWDTDSNKVRDIIHLDEKRLREDEYFDISYRINKDLSHNAKEISYVNFR